MQWIDGFRKKATLPEHLVRMDLILSDFYENQ